MRGRAAGALRGGDHFRRDTGQAPGRVLRRDVVDVPDAENFGTQEPAGKGFELAGVAGRDEVVFRRCGRGPLQAPAGQRAVDVLGGFLGAGHQGDIFAHDIGDHARQERVVRAAQNHGVHARRLERFEVLPRHSEQFRARGDARLHVADEGRAGRGGDFQVRGRREGVLVRPRTDSGGRTDHAHAAGAGRGHRTADGGLDHFDDRNPVTGGVAFAGIAEHRRRRRVAGDREELDAGIHEFVHDAEGVGPHLCDGERSVRAVRGVAHVENGLVGQLIDDGPCHREPADAGVKDPDRARSQVDANGRCGLRCSVCCRIHARC